MKKISKIVKWVNGPKNQRNAPSFIIIIIIRYRNYVFSIPKGICKEIMDAIPHGGGMMKNIGR